MVPIRLYRRRPILRVITAVILPAAATALLPLAASTPVLPLPIALVTLSGAYGWLAARATVEYRLHEVGLVAALATALLAPGGGSLLVPAAIAILRYRRPPFPRAANDNTAAMAVGWVPISPARAKVLLDQTAA
jgi:hypothetical protein